jgi:ammonia channel protein AmtB
VAVDKIWDVSLALNGALAGLVSITSGRVRAVRACVHACVMVQVQVAPHLGFLFVFH